MQFLNLNLMRNPLNWITVLFMLVIFALFADLVLRHYGDMHTTADPAADSRGK